MSYSSRVSLTSSPDLLTIRRPKSMVSDPDLKMGASAAAEPALLEIEAGPGFGLRQGDGAFGQIHRRKVGEGGERGEAPAGNMLRPVVPAE